MRVAPLRDLCRASLMWRSKTAHVSHSSTALASAKAPSAETANMFTPLSADTNMDFKLEVSGKSRACMRGMGKPLIRMVEHGLPEAAQTHEMIVNTDEKCVLATQLEEGRLVKLEYDENGEIGCMADWITIDMPGDQAQEAVKTGEKPFVGMHGLAESYLFPGHVWVTLQFINKIVLVDVKTMQVKAGFSCPREFGDDIMGGPHCVVECKTGKAYVCMKGGASCHGAVASEDEAEEATIHGIYRVDIDPNTGNAIEGTGVTFFVPPTPVMCVLDADHNCWVVTDQSPFVTKIPAKAKSSADIKTVQLPFQYAVLHQTGPGIRIGPDGNPWFCILFGEGLIGKVNRKTDQATVFELLPSEWNPNPRLIHLSWDANDVLYAISSDLVDKKAANSLFRVQFDPLYEQIIGQHELALPTQGSSVHRIAHIDDTKEPSVLVSELAVSQVLQLFKRTLPSLDKFPVKTIETTVRRVFGPDAIVPCPVTGGGACFCAMKEADRVKQGQGKKVKDLYSLPRESAKDVHQGCSSCGTLH